MNKKEFEKYLKRDGHCPCCGTDDDTLICQHRKNRGMGGSKSLNRPSNIIVLCSRMNGLIESDFYWQQEAKKNGWKLESWQDPYLEPFIDLTDGHEYYLDDTYGRTRFRL